MLITCQSISLLLLEHESEIMSKALSVEEGEPGEEAACIVMCLVSHTHVLRDTQEQYHNLLCGYVYVYHINSVSIITVYNDMISPILNQ